MWYDEIATLVNYARLPLSDIVTRFDSQNQHLFFSVLARISMVLFGDGAWALRLPAAIFGVLSLWAVWWFGAELARPREGLLAALLLAVSYHHVWFSQNARGYSMMMFFTLVASGLFLRLLAGRRRRRDVLLYAAVMAACLYTQVAGAFVMAAHGILWLATAGTKAARDDGRWRAPLLALVLGGVLAFVLYAPVLTQMVRSLTTRPPGAVSAAEWKSPLWLAAEMAAGLARGVPGGWWSLVAVAAVGVAGLVSYVRASRVALAAMLLPVAVTAAAMVLTSHNLWPRLFFFAAGFAALIALRGGFSILEWLVPRHAARIGTVAVIVAALASLGTVRRAWAPKQDFLAARDWIEQRRRPGDAVVALDMMRMPAERYLGTDWTPASSPGDLTAAESATGGTMVVYTFPARLEEAQPEIWRRLAASYAEVARFHGTVGGGDVVVMVPR